MKSETTLKTSLSEIERIALGLRLSGFTYEEIGKELWVSRQRAQQLIRPPAWVIRKLKRFSGHRCQQCMVPIKNGHVHHKSAQGMSQDSFNQISNLEYLCVRCHAKKH